jgi:beta-lactamase superfamily II metal-dependent hydrolase
MKIEIHDVGHGGCSVVTCPNGARIMLDCGFSSDRRWFPSLVYADEFIDALVLTNLDEDHVSDLPYVWRGVTLGSIYSNPAVTAAALAAMKRDFGMDEGVRHAHAILCRFGPGRIGPIADSGSVRAWTYSNRYYLDFEDTNNLSVATFIRWGAFTILFAGDLETAGWRTLLQNPLFVDDLRTITVLVASHHGRANGRCEEVFGVVRPQIVVFSDDRKRFESQDTDAWYRHRVSGIPVLGPAPTRIPQGRRHVYTTRRDGTLTIQVDPTGCYLVTPMRADPLAPILGLLGSRYDPAA